MKSENKGTQWVFANFAVISFALLLISHGSITFFYAAYLNHYDVSIEDISFWPKISDLSTYGFASVAVPLVAVVIYCIATAFISYLFKKLHEKSRRKWVSFISEGLTLPRSYIFTTAQLVGVIICFVVIYHTSPDLGTEAAQTRTVYSEAILDDGSKGLLIYQNDNMGVIKSYDSTTGTLDKGYRVVDIAGVEFKRVTLEEPLSRY